MKQEGTGTLGKSRNKMICYGGNGAPILKVKMKDCKTGIGAQKS